MSGTWKRGSDSDVTIVHRGNSITLSFSPYANVTRTFTGAFSGEQAQMKFVPRSTKEISPDLPEDLRQHLITDHHYTYRASVRWHEAETIELSLYYDDVNWNRTTHAINYVTLSNTPAKVLLKRTGVVLPSAVLFDFDRFNLKPGAGDALSNVKAYFVDKNPAATFSIEGHCDDAGTDAYNVELSRKRARSVADWLSAHGVSQSSLEVKGYGKSQPKYPNDTEEHRAGNRRVEIRLAHK